MRIPNACWVGASLLGVVLLEGRAEAQQKGEGPAHELKAELDVPLLLIAGGIASSFFFLDEVPGDTCAPNCDATKVNAFDREAAGLYDTAWGNVGDVATMSTLAFPLIVVLLDEGFENGIQDDLVIAEAALVTSAIQVPLSYAVPRARPRAYGDEAPIEEQRDANASRSFFSGHTANAVAVSVAALHTFHRLDKPGIGWVVFGAGMAGSTVVGVSRVASGAHFPSDVIIGAAVGAGVGWAVPAIHDSGLRVVPQADADRGGLAVAGIVP